MTNESIGVLVALVLGYLCGAFPSGIVAGRLAGGLDVRQTGSGRTGATNVLRTHGIRWAALVAAADIVKGLAPILVVRLLGGTVLVEVAAAFAAVAGHNWSIFIGFSGGRGVLTSLGAFLAMSPLIGLVGLAVFAVTVWRTRYVSLASISGAVVALLIFTVVGIAGARTPGEYYVFAAAAVVLLVVRHSDNIARLRAGTERKLGERAGA